MKLNLPSLKQAAERAEEDSSDGYDIDPSIVLELIRQHGVMREALEKSCICGEFGFIYGKKCPACKALEDV